MRARFTLKISLYITRRNCTNLGANAELLNLQGTTYTDTGRDGGGVVGSMASLLSGSVNAMDVDYLGLPSSYSHR